ncbi:MAG: cytochrome c biogenesis protein ResB [Candidatus Kuenenia sp.]|nr:cytochrome c biogenesis protein ResB [Candidatus Kuenenia hertensis]
MGSSKNKPTRVKTETVGNNEQTKVNKPGQNKKRDSNKVWDFFCSVKLAVIIILVMAVACVLGTIILQGRSFDEYTARHGYGFATFIRITQLNNVFYSYWFSVLLVLLCANLICCTIRRWRNTFLQTGFVLTHLSLVLILLGGVIKFQMGVKGGVNVYEGKSVDYFLTQKIDSMGRLDYVKKSLPFSIALDDFILEKNEPKYQIVTYVKDKDKQKVIEANVGKRQRIPGSDYRVTITDYIPDAELRQEPVNESDKPDNPAIFVKLFGSESLLAEGWLLAQANNYHDEKKRDLRLEYLWLPSQQEFDNAVNTIQNVNAKITASIPELGFFQDYSLELNKTFKLSSSDYSLRILQYVLNYGDTRPISEQPANNPAVQVEIDGPDGVEMRWIFENFPEWDKMHPAKYENVKIACSDIANAHMTRNVIRIYHAPGENQKLVYIKDKQIVETIPWELDKRYSFANNEHQLIISSYFPSFDIKQEVVKKSDQIGTPAIRVRIDGPSGKKEDWLFADSKYATWYKDNNFAMIYEPTGESVKHFISNLRIVKNNQTVMEKSIKVNDPLKCDGYVIYQSSYDPEKGSYSGLQIVKDPGIPVVYSGFGALCFGVIFIFYVKPFLRKKQKKENEVMENEYN